MREYLKKLLFLALFTMFLCAMPVYAQADAFQEVPYGTTAYGAAIEKAEIGGRYFWIDDGTLYYGNSKSAKGEKVAVKVSGAVANGKEIYYNVRKTGYIYGSPASGKSTVYRYKVGGKKTSLGVVKTGAQLVGYAKNNVCFMGAIDFKGYFYTYNIKSKKFTKKRTDFDMVVGTCFGNYVYGVKSKMNPKINLYVSEIYLYNIAAEKGKRICRNVCGHALGKDLFYYEQVDKTTRAARIYAYNVKTGRKTAVTKKYRFSIPGKLTSHSVTYTDDAGMQRTIKF